MADVVSKKMRSQMMAGIRGKGNRSTELRMIGFLKKCGVKGWRRHRPLLGKPDFTFIKTRTVIFVDGCFWHGCPNCYKAPSSNKFFWKTKLAMNKKRDRAVSKKLAQQGWRVFRFWECALDNESKISGKLRAIFKDES